jgi:hypothetical protein
MLLRLLFRKLHGLVHLSSKQLKGLNFPKEFKTSKPKNANIEENAISQEIHMTKIS